MAVTASQIHDLVTATLFSDKKKKVTNIDPTLLRSYVAGRRLVKKNQVQEQTGRGVRFNVNVEGAALAQGIGLYHVDEVSVGDHLQQATMEIKVIKNAYAFDEQEEDFNGEPHQIVDMIKNREMQTKIAMMKTIESLFWSFADTTDTLNPQGILYWLPYVSTEGFNGTVSGSHTTVAGLNPSTYTGWKSYGAPYTAVNQDDLILKLRKAWTEVQFEAPLDMVPIGDYNTGDQFGLYTNLSVTLEMENELRNQNDNLGPDIDAMGGRAVFRRTPFVEVPQLRNITRNPVIGINWGLLKNYVQKGWWMKNKITPAPTQALVTVVHMYCAYQLVMFDRRQGGFNIAKAA